MADLTTQRERCLAVAMNADQTLAQLEGNT